jgi:hypothetical protein
MTTTDHPSAEVLGEPDAAPPTAATGRPPRERTPVGAGDAAGDSRTNRLQRITHRWARWLHVYTSMLALLLVLFFGLTGITLNHPSWTFGDGVDVTTESGTLPIDPTFDDGTTDYLSISEFVRDEFDVNGEVDSFSTTSGQATISYRNAGYAADVLVDLDAATYDITIEQQGWVGVMNDLHKGRDTTSLWKWAIDISAGFLVVISLTGLAMQFVLRKRRRSALTSVGVGAALAVLLMYITLA